MKNIAVLGSTGSIGRQTLDIVRWYPEKFKVKTLAAQRNYKLLAEQALEFKPETVALYDESLYQDLNKREFVMFLLILVLVFIICIYTTFILDYLNMSVSFLLNIACC